nr:helix-turn-helix domain-containing protein [Micrococcus sp. ACRRV]
MSDLDVEQARVMISIGIPKAEVARTFGVSRQTLYASLRRVAP